MSFVSEALNTSRAAPPFAAERYRADFPVLDQEVHGKPLVYLDSAASAQKPRQVIDAISHFYSHDYANIHRGVHALSERATEAFEAARHKVQRFINAASTQEIIFVRGATEAINLVASSYGRLRIREGDELLITHMEHHANIVPWQMLCQHTGAVLRVVPVNDAGELLMDEFYKLLSPRTKIVAVTHISNALGTINPVQDIVRAAHALDVPVLLDGAQALMHTPVDVQALDCDFYVFSGHKLYGPSGIGVLYGKQQWLEAMPPYQGGGEMIRRVTFAKTEYNDLPHKFEAGTPHIAGAVGLGAAIDYLNGLDMTAIAAYEAELLAYASQAVAGIPGLRIIGTAQHKASIVSFVLDKIHPHDVGTILDHEGIAVRTGHHCAMPVMERFGVPATTRASLALYNTRQDVDALVAGLHKVLEVFR